MCTLTTLRNKKRQTRHTLKWSHDVSQHLVVKGGSLCFVELLVGFAMFCRVFKAYTQVVSR